MSDSGWVALVACLVALAALAVATLALVTLLTIGGVLLLVGLVYLTRQLAAARLAVRERAAAAARVDLPAIGARVAYLNQRLTDPRAGALTPGDLAAINTLLTGLYDHLADLLDQHPTARTVRTVRAFTR